MELHERDFFIARISTGYLKIKVSPDIDIYIHPMTRGQSFEAQEVFMEAYHEALEQGIMTRDESRSMMLKTGVWSLEEEKRMQQLEKDMEQYKVDIFSFYFRSESRERAREDLRLQEKEYQNLLVKQHSYDHIDSLGVATYAQTNWIIENTAKFKDDTPYDWKHITAHECLTSKNNIELDDKQLREIAKTSPWANIWATSKLTGTLFEEDTFSLTKEQKVLIAYSSLYDNIKEAYESPTEDVIQDDDACDGWLISQRRQREKDKGQKAADEILNVHPNAQEVMVPAETPEDAARVHALNDQGSELIRKSRLKSLEGGKELNYSEFSDVKMRINSERMDSAKRS